MAGGVDVDGDGGNESRVGIAMITTTLGWGQVGGVPEHCSDGGR